MRVCGDNDTLRIATSTHDSPLTPQHLHQAFIATAAIAGVYVADDSAGVHDAVIPKGMQLSLPRNKLGNVMASNAKPHLQRNTVLGLAGEHAEQARYSHGGCYSSLAQAYFVHLIPALCTQPNALLTAFWSKAW